MTAKQIFLDAIELPADQQDQFVIASCADDAALRARVEGLLRTHRARPAELNQPAVADLDATPHRRAEQPGDVIDRYRLIRPLGEGGFGTVFLAQQTAPLVRDVALKVIRRGMDTDQVIARFAIERQALAMMDHPGIARVLDAGATASGRPYFVMEYVDGVPITHYCEQHKLNVSQRLELIEQASLAVQHAHQKGIIHRDLKPGNILVARVDDRPIPKIIDFGIAKAIDPDAANGGGGGGGGVTLEAQVIGTPQYMSPEQATGSAARIDTRTDVYSLGAVLYELITGSPPFDAAMLRAAPFGAVGQIIRDQTPTKPSKRLIESGRTESITTSPSILSYWRQLPDEIDWIVMKALEKEPARRYQTAADLAADIRRHLSHRAVLAGPPSRLYAVRKFARRHRVSISAAAIVTMTLVVTTITSLLLASRARRAEALARVQAQRAEEELSRSNAIVSFTGDLLGGVGPSVARGRDIALLREILDHSINSASAKLIGHPSAELAVQYLIANALYDLGDSAAAIAQLRRAYDATDTPALHDHPERLRAAALLAFILVERNELDEAERLANEALDGYRRRGEDQSDDAYKARLAQASVDLFTPGRADVAERRFAEILAHGRAIGRGESDLAIRAWNNLALAISKQDRWAEAMDQWRALNAVDRRLFGEDHPYTLMTLVDVGTAQLNLEQFSEAEQTFREALSIARRIYPPGHPTLLVNMNNFATLLIRLNKIDEADAILTEALESGRAKSLATLDQPMDTILLQLGKVRAQQKRFDDALRYTRELHAAVAARFGERNPRTLSVLVYVYEYLLGAQRAAEGVAIVEQIGELPPQVSPEQRQRLHAAAGRLYLAAGNEPAARRHATLARSAVQTDAHGDARVAPNLRLLESELHITPTTQPATRRTPATTTTTAPISPSASAHQVRAATARPGC